MTDLCMYEFEDTVWDEFCRNDDHIVPHPGSQRVDTYSILPDNHKKPRSEVTNVSTATGAKSNASYVNQEQNQVGFSYLKKRKNSSMLEKDPWSRTPSGVFPSSYDGESFKEGSSLASDNTRSSTHSFRSNNTEPNGSEICADDNILGEKNMEVDNNSLSYPLGDVTHAGNNLDFFEDAEDKDSSDFLYYGWPEIGNFEDVDRMFRTSDSTFGLNGTKEDELGWFSSADEIGGSGDVLNSDFKFPSLGSNAVENISQNHDNSKSVSGSAMTSEPITDRDGSWISERSDSYGPFRNRYTASGSNGGFSTQEQEVEINGKIQPIIAANSQSKTTSGGKDEHKKHVKLQKQPMGKRKEHCFENGSFNYMSNLPNEVMHLSSAANTHESVQPACLQKPTSSHDYAYLQNHMSCVNSDNCHFSDPYLLIPPLSAVKSEANSFSSLSQKDSSHASSQLLSSERSHDPSFPSVAIPKREKLQDHQHNQLSVYGSHKSANATAESSLYDPEPSSLCDPESIGKQVQFSVDKFDNHGDTEGVGHFISAELGTSNVQEGPAISSGLDDISLEAASFRQLQLVMEQLDVRTKLCIRDSLYRLARSAEQRHNHANMSGGVGDERDPNGAFVTEGTNNFMDIETDTNPIDRSIAHLLFHRPAESPSGVHGSVTSTPVEVENLVTHEETTAEIEKMVSGH